MADFLAALEGAEFRTPTPKNQALVDLVYHHRDQGYQYTAPWHFTSEARFARVLSGTYMQASSDMVHARCRHFHMPRQLPNPDFTIPRCAQCWAALIWARGRP